MPSFTGAYVARVNDVDLTNGQLLVTIPQVFQGSAIPMDKWSGRRPEKGETGYVVFLNGDATWPVWFGSQLATSASGSDLLEVVGAPEVWVGPEEPSDDDYALWYDTDSATGLGGPTQAEAWFSGSGLPSAGTGAVGDWYLNLSNGDVYEKSTISAWTLRANIMGPVGPASSAVGPQGPPGPTGPPGAASTVVGPPGPSGVDGEKWYASAGTPAGGTGVVGDWHLNSTNGDVSEKTGASTWTLRANIKGPQGETGPAGTGGGTGDVTEEELATALDDYLLQSDFSIYFGGLSTGTQTASMGSPFTHVVGYRSDGADDGLLAFKVGNYIPIYFVPDVDIDDAQVLLTVQSAIGAAQSEGGGAVLLRPYDYPFVEADLTLYPEVHLYRVENAVYPGYDPVDFLGAGGMSDVVIVDADWDPATDTLPEGTPVGARILKRP
jgi:hypothetical protein